MGQCNCTISTWGNTGSPSCEILEGVTRGLIFVSMETSAGTANKIATGATLNKAYFDALINNSDPTARWYPVRNLENVEDVRAEAIYETPPSGYKYKIKDGVRSFKAMAMKKSFVFLSKLEQLGCNDIGVYRIDSNDNLIGITDGTDLYPVRLAKETIDFLKIMTKDNEHGKVQVSFDFDESENDSSLRILTSTTAGIKFSTLNGLLDVTGVVSDISTTGFTLTMTHDYGTFDGTDNKVTDWVKADYELTEVTPTPGTAEITSVTETSDGVYVFVISEQTSKDVLSLSQAAGKLGFELEDVTVTIPS